MINDNINPIREQKQIIIKIEIPLDLDSKLWKNLRQSERNEKIEKILTEYIKSREAMILN